MDSEQGRTTNTRKLWCWRRMLRVSWIEHRTNESILSEIDEGREILKTVRARRWDMIGHILRHENELNLQNNRRQNGRQKGPRTSKNFICQTNDFRCWTIKLRRTEEVSWEQGRVESACPTAKPTLRVECQERERDSKNNNNKTTSTTTERDD